MRANGVRRIAFSSTGSIYGEPEVFPTPETAPFPVQTSLYGASKLAGEGLIQAYCEGFGFQGYHLPLRVDPRRALLARPRLRLLSEPARRPRRRCGCWATATSASRTSTSRTASTRSSCAIEKRPDKVNIFNLGTDEYCEVNDSIGWITGHLGLDPARTYTGGERGLDRRQPVHLPRHGQDPIARLEAEAVDPRGRHQDARLPRGESLAAGAAVVKVCVVGLWHLGTVTAACLAAGGPRRDRSRLRRGRRRQTWRPASRRCSSRGSKISSRPASRRPPALHDRRRCRRAMPTSSGWPTTRRSTTTIERTWSTSSNGSREAVSASPRRRARADLLAGAGRHDRGGSSRCSRANRRAARVGFGYSPENLRLGKAIDVFTHPDRVVVGVRSPARPRKGDGAAPAVHRADRVDVGRVGRDDQARAQRVPGDVGDVHQRDRRALRAGRRRCDRSRARV